MFKRQSVSTGLSNAGIEPCIYIIFKMHLQKCQYEKTNIIILRLTYLKCDHHKGEHLSVKSSILHQLHLSKEYAKISLILMKTCMSVRSNGFDASLHRSSCTQNWVWSNSCSPLYIYRGLIYDEISSYLIYSDKAKLVDKARKLSLLKHIWSS